MIEQLLIDWQCCLECNYVHVARKPLSLNCGAVCCQECFRHNREIREEGSFFCLKCQTRHDSPQDPPTVSPLLHKTYEFLLQANLNSVPEHIKSMNTKKIEDRRLAGSKDKENLVNEIERAKNELERLNRMLYKYEVHENRNEMFIKRNIDQLREKSHRTFTNVEEFFDFQDLMKQSFNNLQRDFDTAEFHPTEAVQLDSTAADSMQTKTILLPTSGKRPSDSIADNSPKIRACESSSSLANSSTSLNFKQEAVEHECLTPEPTTQSSGDEDLFQPEENPEVGNNVLFTEIAGKYLVNEHCIDYKRKNLFFLSRISTMYNNELYFTDERNDLVNSVSIETYEVKQNDTFLTRLLMPCGLALDHVNGRLFVGIVKDDNNPGISVYDLRNFRLLVQFGAMRIIMGADTLEYDHYDDNLYVVSKDPNHKVTVWNVTECRFLKSFKFPSPGAIRVTRSYLFIASCNDGDFGEAGDEGKASITNKTNCIFMLDKTRLTEIRRIELDDWYNPRGLFVDSNLNIMTIARSLDSNNIITSDNQTQSYSDYFYCFDVNGHLLSCIPVPKYENIFDFQLFKQNDETKIMLVRGDKKPAIVVFSFQ